MKNISTKTLAVIIFILVSATVTSNYIEQFSVDQSKLPEKVERSKGFQRWITNLKNKGFEIEADEFRLLEDNEIYNTKWLRVYNFDNDEIKQDFEENIAKYKMLEEETGNKIEFSPSNRQFLDIRMIFREGYNGSEFKANEVYYFGLRDDKLIDARIVDCSESANCYFDRAWFLDNESFVISELSMDPLGRDEDGNSIYTPCNRGEECTYTFKLHVVDLINNKRVEYQSKPQILILDEVLPEL